MTTTDTLRLVPASLIADTMNWMARAYERIHGLPRISDTDLADKVGAAKERLRPYLDAPAVQPAAGREEIARVEGYLRRLAKSRQHDQEFIHSFDMGEPSEACLLVSDLRAILAAISTPAQASGEPVARPVSVQRRVDAWMLECFGAEISADKVERADRFIEEALELVQAVGYDAARAHALVDYVFGRDVGEPAQEVGGVMVTLAALCNTFGLDIQTAADTEIDRITRPEIVLKIRAKQAAKPTGSALPVAHPTAQASESGGPDSFSGVGKFFLALDHLTRTTWRWGESCGIDNVSWDEKGDSYNEGCRDDHLKAKHAVVEAFHAAVAEKAALSAPQAAPGEGEQS